MVLTIFIAFLSLIALIVIHEFGHFFLAKRFGVKVEEFGIGYPPRIIGKKIGETIYSLNLLPFGAFVKIYGEEGGIESAHSFSGKPIWQRAAIVVAGVVSFWLVAAILLSVVMVLGTPTAISDEETKGLVDPKVQVVAIAPDSPAAIAGIKVGDTIKQLTINGQQLTVNTTKDVQEFSNLHKGKEVVVTIERGKEVFDVSLVSRESPPTGEGPLGVALIRTALKSYPWWQAPWQGIVATYNLTLTVVEGYIMAISNIFKGMPSGVEVMGPVGIFSLFSQVSQLGANYFIQFVAIIAIYIAIFNILPIPALDGGKLLFLGIEAIRKKPISPKIEQNITALFFGLLILLIIIITIKDVIKIF